MALAPGELAALSRLLDEALALPVAARAAWLEALPAEHASLRGRLRDLLGAAENGATVLTLPRLPAEPASSALPGERLGPWRLLREIGHGGMGAVWLAERADGAFERVVALKLPRLAWSNTLAARMAFEQRIAARLEHPAIARLYDAGSDDRGRPYLAMEYVDGQPIDTWLRQQRPALPDTLSLFVQVVRAVAYAHGQLVVHCDLKPSNVLVTADGRVQLLDFGIARLLGGEGAATGMAPDGIRALTPRYAAPEQIAGQPVGVQADVFSLGVMLYELLTGALPYRPPGPEEPAAAEPPPASTRVAGRAAAALRGDLDAILAKALRRNPAERYASADALAADLERHLRGDSIAARRLPPRERLLRLLRRHRLGFGAGALVLVALLAGGGVALLQGHRAQQALAREQQVRLLLGELLRAGTGGLSQEEVLQRQAKAIRQRLPEAPALQAELHGLLATALQDLGLSQAAASHGERQVALLAETEAASALRAHALTGLARMELENQRLDEAERHARQALELATGDAGLADTARVLLARVLSRQSRRDEADRVMAALPAAGSARAPLTEAWISYLEADRLRRSGNFAAAEPRYRQAIDAASRVGATGGGDAAQMQLDLAYELIVRNRRAEGQALMEPALAALSARGPTGAAHAAAQRAALITNMALMGQIPAAEALATLAAVQAQLPAQAGSVGELTQARLDFHRARLLGVQGHVREAFGLLQRAVPRLLTVTRWANARYSLVNAHGRIALQAGEHEQARALVAQALQLRHEMGQARIPFAAVSHAYVAMSGIMTGDFAAAERALDAAPAFEPERSDPVAGAVYATLLPWHRVRLALERGDLARAQALAQPLGRGEDDTDTDFLAPAAIHAELACAGGRAAEGLVQLEAMAQRRAKEVDAAVDPTLARLRALAGQCQLALGRRGPAQRLAALAAVAFERQPAVSPWFKQPLERLRQRLAAAPQQQQGVTPARTSAAGPSTPPAARTAPPAPARTAASPAAGRA